MNAKKLFLLIITSISLFFVACGGGQPPADGSGENVNGDLSGTIFIGGRGEGWLLDLESGRYTRIPGVDWENQNQNYHALARLRAYPRRDGAEFVLKVNNCKRTDDPNYPSRYEDCLSVHSGSGSTLSSVDIFQTVVSEPKISRDGQHIAFFYDDVRASSVEGVLVITTRDFAPISAVELSGSLTSSSIAWFPDNQSLAYAHDNRILVTDLAQTNTRVLLTFTEGDPEQISVSPDGSQILFVLDEGSTTGATRASLWVINVDGTGLRELADVIGRDPSFEFPAWSPDGQYIVVAQGRVPASSPTNLGLAGGLYVIPADSDGVLLDDSNTGVTQILSYFGTTSGQSNPSLTTNLSISNGTIAWLP